MNERTFLRQIAGVDIVVSGRTSHVAQDSDIPLYRCVDVQGLAVLDIGAFIGETAVLFHAWGASHVTLVEAAEENFPLIQANMALHHVPHTLIHAFVGDRAGEQDVHYSAVDVGFGIAPRHPKFTRRVTVETLESVIRRTPLPPHLIKCDCEGGERGFLTMQEDTLRSVPFYIIETHGKKLTTAILQCFAGHRYRGTNLTPTRRRVSTDLHLFERM